MWNRNRLLYVIHTLDENKKINGVYVGSANDIKQRISSHLAKKEGENDNQKELHEIMRRGAFLVRSFGVITFEERWREYELIRFFQDYTDLRIYNTYTDFHKDDGEG